MSTDYTIQIYYVLLDSNKYTDTIQKCHNFSIKYYFVQFCFTYNSCLYHTLRHCCMKEVCIDQNKKSFFEPFM